MVTIRKHPDTPNTLAEVAHDVVRHAARSEGLEAWLTRFGGSLAAPSLATRRYADDLLGDSDDAVLFNAALVLEVDRQRAAARRRVH